MRAVGSRSEQSHPAVTSPGDASCLMPMQAHPVLGCDRSHRDRTGCAPRGRDRAGRDTVTAPCAVLNPAPRSSAADDACYLNMPQPDLCRCCVCVCARALVRVCASAWRVVCVCVRARCIRGDRARHGPVGRPERAAVEPAVICAGPRAGRPPAPIRPPTGDPSPSPEAMTR